MTWIKNIVAPGNLGSQGYPAAEGTSGCWYRSLWEAVASVSGGEHIVAVGQQGQ